MLMIPHLSLEIFNELLNKRLETITDINKKVNRYDLIYRYILIMSLIIHLADAKNNQEKFKSYLEEVKKGNKKHRSKVQKNTLYNFEML